MCQCRIGLCVDAYATHDVGGHGVGAVLSCDVVYDPNELEGSKMAC